MTGFVLSVILTAIPFCLVMARPIESPGYTAAIVLACAFAQILVHMVFFLHMTPKAEDGWLLLSTIFTIVFVVITLAGSIWIVFHLNRNMMPGAARARDGGGDAARRGVRPRAAARACARARSSRAIAVAAVVAGLVALGVWQLERRAWKLDLIARVDARLAAGPVAAPGPGRWRGALPRRATPTPASAPPAASCTTARPRCSPSPSSAPATGS